MMGDVKVAKGSHSGDRVKKLTLTATNEKDEFFLQKLSMYLFNAGVKTQGNRNLLEELMKERME